MLSPEEQFQKDHDAIMSQLMENATTARNRGELAVATHAMEVAISMAVSYRSVNGNISLATKQADAKSGSSGGIGGFMQDR